SIIIVLSISLITIAPGGTNQGHPATQLDFDAVDLYFANTYIGMGIPQPTEKLDVDGNLKLTGNIDLAGNINGIKTITKRWSGLTGSTDLGTLAAIPTDIELDNCGSGCTFTYTMRGSCGAWDANSYAGTIGIWKGFNGYWDHQNWQDSGSDMITFYNADGLLTDRIKAAERWSYIDQADHSGFIIGNEEWVTNWPNSGTLFIKSGNYWDNDPNSIKIINWCHQGWWKLEYYEDISIV
ncbi:MAG: hypothetical protein QF632_05345, partial [Candidatus Woesearchaeota archaeon]|nr:hypothetical protein [Candidatus Woesearchaeota archaeon]